MALENKLVDELVRSGAEEGEARRLALVADVLSGVALEIDATFADRVEEMILAAPTPASAKVIPLPTPAMTRSKRRWAMASAAAAVVLFAALGVSMKAGIFSDSVPGPAAGGAPPSGPSTIPPAAAPPAAPRLQPPTTAPGDVGGVVHKTRPVTYKAPKRQAPRKPGGPGTKKTEAPKRCSVSTQVGDGGVTANCAASSIASMS